MALLSPGRKGIHGWLAALSRGAGRLFACVIIAVTFSAAAAETAIPTEYQLKAVFLYNFAQFVEWPAAVFAHPHSPFVIGILGADPFGGYLDELVSGETVGDRALQIRRYKRAEDIRDCHILFIVESDANALERTIGQLKNRGILTVGDVEGFNRVGGMVRFVNEAGKIRLRINIAAARASGLTVSSKILRPDMIVTTGRD